MSGPRLRICGVVLLCVAACQQRDLPGDETGVKKWTGGCARRLISDAASWYNRLDPSIDQARLTAEIEVFLAAAGSLKAYRVVADATGRPVDLTWDEGYWEAAADAMSPEAMGRWKSFSVQVLSEVLVATGIRLPPSWTDVVASPVVEAIGEESGLGRVAAIQSLNRLLNLPAEAPVTARLRPLMPKFPEPAAFATPPGP